MKKLLLLFAAVALVFVACNKQKNNGKQPEQQSDSIANTASLTIGVIDTDSIRENYSFSVQGLISMNKKIADEDGKLKARNAQLQKEAEEFQKKYENNAFLSRDRAEQEMQRIQKKGEDLSRYQESVQNKLAQEQQDFFKQLQDSINMAINELNKGNRFSIVLSKSNLTNTVLYVKPQYNITEEVLKFLNERYNK